MLWHMVVQMPLLMLAGWLTMAAWPRHSKPKFMAAWNVYGLNGFFLTFFILAYWMLPSAIDRAVVLPQADVVKLLTLLAAGALSKHAFDRSPSVLQLFFVALTVSMLIWLGVYFITTELRLCNAYSLASQVSTGWGLIGLGIAIGGAWLLYNADIAR
jgi:phage shock protein PspC (stress-responsive transcriptional regulator)